MTPIRVTHELQLQIFYSVEGETVARAQMEGPGDLRKMQVKIPIIVPSVRCADLKLLLLLTSSGLSAAVPRMLSLSQYVCPSPIKSSMNQANAV